MGPENTSVGGKTPTPAPAGGRAAGLGVTPAELTALRRAVQREDFDAFRAIVEDYLARRGLNAWWEGLVLVAHFSEAKDVISALRELFKAAKIPADMVAWSSGGYGPVRIGLDIPWGERA